MSRSEESVQVYVRVRPEADTVPSSSSSCVSVADEVTVRLVTPESAMASRKGGGVSVSSSVAEEKLFSFNKVFPDSSSQEDIYDSVAPLVRATVHGYNTTIFAYGATGSGKSYTMTGCSAAPGIIPRAISEVFSVIETSTSEDNDMFFYVRISYVELYNNTFRNLLDFASKDLSGKDHLTDMDPLNISLNSSAISSGSNRRRTEATSAANSVRGGCEKIEVRESQSTGVFLAGVNLRIPVTSAKEAFQLINRGNKHRAVGSTQCNDLSSRSHAILTLHVESKIVNARQPTTLNGTSSNGVPPELRLGKMHLVDLAGSERLALSAAEGDTLVETQSINLSLTALGDVLSALSKNANIMAQHKNRAVLEPTTKSKKAPPAMIPVPYRNSKLTHLLKDSLGGNSKTVMIANIRQGEEYFQMTSISLMYASRANKIKNHSVVNRNVIGDTGIHAVSSEIERLRGRLDERTNEFERLRMEQMRDAKENMALKVRLEELNAANENEKKLLEKQMSNVIHSQAGQLASQRQKISSLQQALQQELAVSQNRIAEQEKEIRWLKQALDESAVEARQPKEQLVRMQSVLDGWQSQAESTQKELQASVNLVEELRARNTNLSQEIRASKNAHQQLSEELSERTQELFGLAVSSQQKVTSRLPAFVLHLS